MVLVTDWLEKLWRKCWIPGWYIITQIIVQLLEKSKLFYPQKIRSNALYDVLTGKSFSKREYKQ